MEENYHKLWEEKGHLKAENLDLVEENEALKTQIDAVWRREEEKLVREEEEGREEEEEEGRFVTRPSLEEAICEAADKLVEKCNMSEKVCMDV